MGHFSDKFRIKVLDDKTVFLSIAHNDDFVEEYQIDTEEWIRMFSLCSEGANYRTDTLSVKYKGRKVHVFFRVSPGFRKGFACSDSEFLFLGSRLSASLHGLSGIDRETGMLVASELPNSATEEAIVTFSTKFFSVIENMSESIMTKIEKLDEKIANIDMSRSVSDVSFLDSVSQPMTHAVDASFTLFEDEDELFIPDVFAGDMKGSVTAKQTESTDTADEAVEALKALRRKK